MYNQTGVYVSIAGIIVSILGHFGISAESDSIAQVIGAGVIVYGLIKQYIEHKKLAVATGAYIKK
jgi:hypothetical protein